MHHIVFITPGFPKDESDSTCIPPLQALVRELTEKHLVHITIIALHYPFERMNYQWHGVEVHACGGANRKWMRLFILNRATSVFKQIIKYQHVDGVHSFWLNDSAVTGYLIAKKFRIPHWVTLMGQDALPGNRFINFFKRIKNTRKAKYLETIALSDFHNEQFLKTTGKEADHIIPWGLDVRMLPPYQEMKRSIDLLGVGSLIRLKNYDVFLQTIASLKKQKPDISCMLIGDGPERVHLESMAVKAGLRQNLTFTGKLPRHEVIEIMMQSRILFHPSMYESFGYVFLEALYAGMDIISRSVGFAKSSDNWHIVHHAEDWISITETVLQKSEKNISQLPEIMSETALSYRRLWNS